MQSSCNICPLLEHPSHQVLVTEYWAVNLGKDQLYLGRSFVTIREHKGRLADLGPEEWEDFGNVVHMLENAYKEAFGALPVNWTCMLNHSYKKEPVDPHIYWHVFPRYKDQVMVSGIEFRDDEYGEHYSLDKTHVVTDDVIDEIVAKLKPYLAG